jgi:hypothetical protein
MDEAMCGTPNHDVLSRVSLLRPRIVLATIDTYGSVRSETAETERVVPVS